MGSSHEEVVFQRTSDSGTSVALSSDEAERGFEEPERDTRTRLRGCFEGLMPRPGIVGGDNVSCASTKKLRAATMQNKTPQVAHAEHLYKVADACTAAVRRQQRRLFSGCRCNRGSEILTPAEHGLLHRQEIRHCCFTARVMRAALLQLRQQVLLYCLMQTFCGRRKRAALSTARRGFSRRDWA